jgi:demethylmenaquinone methyltransferase / 2-methoxy-6-polyprenyl-1,4-benzoquinol methylase
MFDDIVERYDALNSVLSLGMDRRWRRRTANAVHVEGGDRVLDLGCGTGKLGELLADKAEVVGVDLSHAMLKRAHDQLGHRMSFVQGSAFHLPFPEAAFRAAVSGFVLRNLDDLPRAFRELARVVGPGGTLAMIDITEPRGGATRRLLDGYLALVAPFLGGMVGKRKAYRYLVRSVGNVPPVPEMFRLLDDAGFEQCRATPLTWGRVTLFTARRR